jgi:hypothetical protein
MEMGTCLIVWGDDEGRMRERRRDRRIVSAATAREEAATLDSSYFHLDVAWKLDRSWLLLPFLEFN